MRKIYFLSLTVLTMALAFAQQTQNAQAHSAEQSLMNNINVNSNLNLRTGPSKVAQNEKLALGNPVADTANPAQDLTNAEPPNNSPLDAVRGLKEQTHKRDLYSKTFDNGDGTYTALIGAGPIHYQKNGQFYDIDHSIKANPDANFPYANTSNLLESFFGSSAHKGVKSKTSEGEVLEFINNKMFWEVNAQQKNVQSGSNPAATVQDNKLYYNNLFGQISAEFTVLTGKRDLNYIIPNKQALGNVPENADYLVFSEDIILPVGWSFSMNEKGVLIKNNTGKNIYLYDNPKSTDELSEFFSEQNTIFEVQQIGQILTVKTKVKTEWLLSEDRVFPIKVDPSVTVYPNNSEKWTGCSTQAGNTNYGDIVLSGRWTDGNPMAGYAKFNLSSIPNGTVLDDVSSHFFFYASNGEVIGKEVELVDINVDPVTAQNPAIINSHTQVISDNTQTFDNFQGWKIHNFSNAGISFVESKISQNWVAVALYPVMDTWSVENNFAGFRGYTSTDNKPYLKITYGSLNCIPRTRDDRDDLYIKDVRFLGALNPTNVVNLNNGYNNDSQTGGYQDFTDLWNTNEMPRQAQGQVINVHAQLNSWRGHFKAWVDWNKDGVFNNTELVYDTESTVSNAVLFGFVIPPDQEIGEYKLRIRVLGQRHRVDDNWVELLNQYDFDPCEEFINYNNSGIRFYGEAEDYKFKVIPDCDAKVAAVNVNEGDGVRCGPGDLNISAQGPAGALYNWYASQYGDDPIQIGQSSNTLFIEELEETTTYWVTVTAGGCESVARVPVIARIDPIPQIEIGGGMQEICGDDASLNVNAWGDYEQIFLIDETFNDEFENGGLGAFTNFDASDYQGADLPEADWKNRENPYTVTKPPYRVLRPAMSSGYNNGRFATAITDLSRYENITKILELTDKVDATELTELRLEFELYFQAYIGGDETQEHLKLQISKDNGSSWTTLQTYINTLGNPGRFVKQEFPLDASYQVDNLKIRFVLFTFAGPSGWKYNIAALDNIRLYGNRALEPKFIWAAVNDEVDIYDIDCETPYNGEDVSEVCIKPNDEQLEANAFWTLKSTAVLSNGCTVDGQVVLQNTTKVWNSNNTDWSVATDWKPSVSFGSPTVPSAENCVIVKKTVYLDTDAADNPVHGLAKNLTVRNTGHLEIKDGASLRVTDFVKNQSSAEDNFVVKNNASLLQINDNAANEGKITVEKEYLFSSERKEYNFVAAPVVANKFMKTTIYDPNPISLQQYNESNDYFYENQGAYVSGKAYAVQESPGSGVETKIGNFSGEHFNGILNYNLTKNGAGFNLVGNPYPSNLDIKMLYDNNVGNVNDPNIDSNFYFWDNRDNQIHVQMGSEYTQNQYAVFNAASGTNGTGVHAPRFTEEGSEMGEERIPDRFVKVGTGFMMQTLKPNFPLHFENSYRTAEGEINFTGKQGNLGGDPDRYWLRMVTPGNIQVMCAVVYFEGGKDEFWIDDTESLGGSDDLFTMADGHMLAIQGRAPFRVHDQIPLGYRAFHSGTHIISIYQKQGVFDSEQDIYLIDHVLSKTVNLSTNVYKFTTRKGEYQNRFTIVYVPKRPDISLSDISNVVQMTRINNQIVIESTIDKITAVEVFDLNSRPVYNRAGINSNQHSLSAQFFNHQIIVVKVTTETGEVHTKKFINN